MRNFTSGLYFRDEKDEDLKSCPVKNKYMGHDWGHEFVKKKSCKENQMFYHRTRFWG